MDKEKTIAEIINKLGYKKGAFLSSVENAIKNEIQSCTITECLTIVERQKNGSILKVWKPSQAMNGYTFRLIAFLRKKKYYKGHILDSFLTDKVVEIVNQKYCSFINQNIDLFARSLLNALVADKYFVNALAKEIYDTTNSTLPAVIKSQLATLFVHKLENSLNTNIVEVSSKTLALLISKIVGTAAAIPISKSLMIAMLKHLTYFLKGAIAKVLASAAMKSVIAASIKKIAAVKIMGALIYFVGSKIGLSAGASVYWVIAPIIIALIIREFQTLPRKLGKKISVEIRDELDGKFQEMNSSVVSKIVNDFVVAGIGAFVGDVLKETSIKENIKTILQNNKA